MAFPLSPMLRLEVKYMTRCQRCAALLYLGDKERHEERCRQLDVLLAQANH